MADDDTPTPEEKPVFDDLFADIADAAAYDWDGDEVEVEQEEKTHPVVCFRIGNDLFAIAGDSVREILGSTERTDLPGTPPHIRGITIVRRQVVGLLSLRVFLELDDDDQKIEDLKQGNLSTERTLIVDTAHYTVGLHVDEVTGLNEWPESALTPDSLPGNMRDMTHRYARGARSQDETLCVYLDLEALLDDAAVQ